MCMHQCLRDTARKETDNDVPDKMKHDFWNIRSSCLEPCKSLLPFIGNSSFDIRISSFRSQFALLGNANCRYSGGRFGWLSGYDDRHIAPGAVVRIPRQRGGRRIVSTADEH